MILYTFLDFGNTHFFVCNALCSIVDDVMIYKLEGMELEQGLIKLDDLLIPSLKSIKNIMASMMFSYCLILVTPITL